MKDPNRAAGHPWRAPCSLTSTCQVLPWEVAFRLTKFRPDGFIFLAWKNDHAPRHVHVYRDGKLVLRWNLTEWCPMAGRATREILDIIRQLEAEGRL